MGRFDQIWGPPRPGLPARSPRVVRRPSRSRLAGAPHRGRSVAKAKRTQRSGARETAANVGYEAQLWQVGDALRGSMDAAEYKRVCLGLRGGKSIDA